MYPLCCRPVARKRSSSASRLQATGSIVGTIYRVTQKNGNFWKTQQKLKKSKKKNIDRNWTIKTCLLRDSNPNYQCLKSTSCRWRAPPRMHSFTANKHFKSSRSFVSPCVCCMSCRMRLCRILQFALQSSSIQQTAHTIRFSYAATILTTWAGSIEPVHTLARI